MFDATVHRRRLRFAMCRAIVDVAEVGVPGPGDPFDRVRMLDPSLVDEPVAALDMTVQARILDLPAEIRVPV